MMSTAYAIYLVSPLVQTEGVTNPKKMNAAFWVLLAGAAVFGAGSGAFQAVDLALAIDTLPSKRDAGTMLGIWTIAYFVGASIGPAVCGLLLEGARAYGDGFHYHYVGYVVIMLLGTHYLFNQN